jgi:hypothetical protein
VFLEHFALRHLEELPRADELAIALRGQGQPRESEPAATATAAAAAAVTDAASPVPMADTPPGEEMSEMDAASGDATAAVAEPTAADSEQ